MADIYNNCTTGCIKILFAIFINNSASVMQKLRAEFLYLICDRRQNCPDIYIASVLIRSLQAGFVAETKDHLNYL